MKVLCTSETLQKNATPAKRAQEQRCGFDRIEFLNSTKLKLVCSSSNISREHIRES